LSLSGCVSLITLTAALTVDAPEICIPLTLDPITLAFCILIVLFSPHSTPYQPEKFNSEFLALICELYIASKALLVQFSAVKAWTFKVDDRSATAPLLHPLAVELNAWIVDPSEAKIPVWLVFETFTSSA